MGPLEALDLERGFSFNFIKNLVNFTDQSHEDFLNESESFSTRYVKSARHGTDNFNMGRE